MNNENWEDEFEKRFRNITNELCIRGSYVVTPKTDPVNHLKDFITRTINQTLESAAKAIEEKYSGEIATDGVTKIIRDMKTK